ncbi:uncharacterized protein [Clytia hemisphaerica]|uniref:uncharacterized protein n=1 Tax=Clytia hemisphaerica TaxID=252671 RepID=UPI0034D6D244
MSSVQEKTKIKEIFSTLVESDASNKQEKEEKDPNIESNVSCNPQSKDLFLERVKTFTTTNWAAKPNELSPLKCAQYGWCNEELDQLRCVTCSATIFAGMPDDWDSSAYSDICNEIKDKLKIGHQKLCPWPQNPCPPSFLSLPSRSAQQWKMEIRSAFCGLLELKGNLPELNEDTVASMKSLDNSCIEKLLTNVFRHSCDTDDEVLQAKVACILAVTGWNASQPIVEDPSITCSLCGKESGLWHYKSLSSRRNAKQQKLHFESATSQQSLSEDFMSSRVSVKSENSTHSGSVTHELSKLATSSDSLAHSDLLKPAGSQESLVNLRVSDSKHMSIDHDHDDADSMGGGHYHSSHPPHSIMKSSIFSEPARIPLATPQELMKELLLSTAPGGRSHRFTATPSSAKWDPNVSRKELEKAITENPPSSHPNHVQQQWMKELLFMTADNTNIEATESVMSEIGSISFDRRLDSHSIAHTPRAMTPVHQTEDEDGEPVRTKRMRFQEPFEESFNMLSEHRHWCPWTNILLASPTHDDVHAPAQSDNVSSTTSGFERTPRNIFGSRTQALPGWKIVLMTIFPALGRDVSSPVSPPPPNEAWKSVRTLLGDCVSPYKPAATSSTTSSAPSSLNT